MKILTVAILLCVSLIAGATLGILCANDVITLPTPKSDNELEWREPIDVPADSYEAGDVAGDKSDIPDKK